jgi:hypothetical protein
MMSRYGDQPLDDASEYRGPNDSGSVPRTRSGVRYARGPGVRARAWRPLPLWPGNDGCSNPRIDYIDN